MTAHMVKEEYSAIKDLAKEQEEEFRRKIREQIMKQKSEKVKARAAFERKQRLEREQALQAEVAEQQAAFRMYEKELKSAGKSMDPGLFPALAKVESAGSVKEAHGSEDDYDDEWGEEGEEGKRDSVFSPATRRRFLLDEARERKAKEAEKRRKELKRLEAQAKARAEAAKKKAMEALRLQKEEEERQQQLAQRRAERERKRRLEESRRKREERAKAAADNRAAKASKSRSQKGSNDAKIRVSVGATPSPQKKITITTTTVRTNGTVVVAKTTNYSVPDINSAEAIAAKPQTEPSVSSKIQDQKEDDDDEDYEESYDTGHMPYPSPTFALYNHVCHSI